VPGTRRAGADAGTGSGSGAGDRGGAAAGARLWRSIARAAGCPWRENRGRCGLEKRGRALRVPGVISASGRWRWAALRPPPTSPNCRHVREDEFDSRSEPRRVRETRSARRTGRGRRRLAVVREFVRQAEPRLAPGTPLLLECAPTQTGTARGRARGSRWFAVRSTPTATAGADRRGAAVKASRAAGRRRCLADDEAARFVSLRPGRNGSMIPNW